MAERHINISLNQDYPTNAMSLDSKRRWAQEQGFSTTPEGLLLPLKDQSLLDTRIVPTISEAQSRLGQAKANGKYGLYVPGSYDLAHIGHLSFIQQAINYSLKQIRVDDPTATREDLFVISLIDSDALVQKNKAHKHISNGGDEEFTRPIEAGYDTNGRHPRLDAVASLPIDCVGFLPAPTDASHLLPPPIALNYEYAQLSVDQLNISEKAKAALHRALSTYSQLTESIQNGASEFGEWWSIEGWQLYLTLALSSGQKSSHLVDIQPFSKGNLTRIISADDFKYFDEVRAISHISGVAVAKLEDIHAHSTTQLVHQFNPQVLLESKRRSLQL